MNRFFLRLFRGIGRGAGRGAGRAAIGPVCLSAAGAFLSGSLPAAAEAWRVIDTQGRAGAEVCPVDGPTSRETFCFALACSPGGPPGFEIRTWGLTLPAESYAIEIGIDGARAGLLPMTPLAEGEETVLRSDWRGDADAALAEAMRRGGAATLNIDLGYFAFAQPLSLDGSAVALEKALGMCRTP
ncbi:hypothetical protein EKE94_05720 [Mesobaculum littorinae]|uniref:Uncharacterized protein n=1 Tax=Mesobaculum littorinae TaxID=2486419 RepID=A0A438AIF9_9RHOB|nr:hypothetical protein [Mesobaculum littorinae]RVV98418.1 hypothetical protein EKE94_05720 [Mesobaculum littorinae]